jgi:hypothetical protein
LGVAGCVVTALAMTLLVGLAMRMERELDEWVGR